MRAAYVVATEFAEFDERPAEKRFREVSGSNGNPAGAGRPTPNTNNTGISNLTLMQPLLLNSFS